MNEAVSRGLKRYTRSLNLKKYMKAKAFFSILFFSIYALQAYAQRPIVNSISKTSAAIEEEISISGSGFGTSTANIRVYFGAVFAPAVSVSENLIKVKVPKGATYSSIAVTNLASGLTGYSSQQFGLSFNGDGFDASKFDDIRDVNAGLGIFDLCLCDFDGDGRSDVATSNEIATDIGVFKNNSGTNNIALATRQAISLGVPSPTRNITCGDIDGDGKPDIVVSGGGTSPFTNTVFVLRNTSTGLGNISFAIPIQVTISATNAARIIIRDLDLDGKPELIVTNNADNKVAIFHNNSTAGNISFSAAQYITVSAATYLNGLAVEDLNNDGLPEIIVNTLQLQNIYVLKNNSTTGSFSFGAPTTLNSPIGVVNLVVGDFDNDGKPDIAYGNIFQDNIGVFRNTSSASAISFAGAKTYGLGSKIWGVAIGDVDGDGLQDIVGVSHLASNVVSVLMNNSTSGNISFTAESIPIASKSRNIKMGDMNQDGKPDFVFLDTDNHRVATLKNKSCVNAMITPAGPHTVCAGSNLTLSATPAATVSYQWMKDGTLLTGATNSTYEPTASGSYTVTITSTNDGCSSTSSAVDVTVDTGPGLGVTPQFNPIPPVCIGGNIHLSATPVSGATYHWTGPNGFSATTTTSSTVVTNAISAKSGEYTVVIKTGACSTAPLSENAVVYGLPNPTITTTGATSFCEDNGSVLLSAGSGFDTYQWKRNGVAISGATTASYTATTSGNYSVVVANTVGCSNESAATTVNKLLPPTAAFTAPSASCSGEEVVFKNTSTADGGAVSYLWDFGDGNSSSESHPAHTYTHEGHYEVKLIASYSPTCKSEFSRTIDIVDASLVEIVAEGSTDLCRGDSVKLSVPEGFQTYVWSNGSLTSSTYASKEGVVHLTIKTAEGCTMTSSINIRVSGPEVEIATEKETLSPGESTRLLASGAFTYVWEPAEGLSDPTASDPVASPERTTTYKVTGTDDIGCTSTAEITITVDNELNVSPPKLFLPTSEAFWEIPQMDYFPECTVLIFNKQGMKLYEQKDYAQLPWNGTYNGQPVPSGVYYFIIRCNDAKNVKTGSITLMR